VCAWDDSDVVSDWYDLKIRTCMKQYDCTIVRLHVRDYA
jgi:hypothetical protein